jgi:hypothetical protein
MEKVITIKIKKKTHDKVKEIAKMEGRTIQGQIAVIVNIYLKNYKSLTI